MGVEPPLPETVDGLDDSRKHLPIPQLIRTPFTDFFNIEHPICLAGMNQAASPQLAAAVANAGGLAVIGGVGYTPKFLRSQLRELKSLLRDPKAPFGVDLLIPQVGGNARATNYDYTKGALPELIDVMIEEGAKLFVCAVGVPPKFAVDKLHQAGIMCMNVVGHPKHVKKALESGADGLIAQAGEAGGHTGDIPFTVLIPRIVDILRSTRATSPLTGQPVLFLAGGGIFDGRGLAASLAHGAHGVWVGTRFVATQEAGAPKKHKEAILRATFEDMRRTVIFTGRPLRLVTTPYIEAWEAQPAKIKELTSKGIVPVSWDLEQDDPDGEKMKGALAHYFAGYVAGVIDDLPYAREVINSMVREGAAALARTNSLLVAPTHKL